MKSVGWWGMGGIGRRQALGPSRREKQASYLGNSDYLTLETRSDSFTPRKNQGKTKVGRRKQKASHHINHPPADESSVSGLKRDWVEMLLWQNYFCQVPNIR